ncbi:MAG TPA: hypothetical protein VJV79_32335 [Polyangiaceae bacterium]|nr:hypothetical protein [Polyangiaceae bacterium]
MATKKEDRVVKDIIKRYGAELNLKTSPYLIVEIIRQFAPRLGGGLTATCLPPGGPPPRKFDPRELIGELRLRVAEVERLAITLEKTLKRKPASTRKRK